MKKVYNIRLKLKTPLHINAGSGSDGRRFFVSDKIGAYIPATLIKGILRNRMEMQIVWKGGIYAVKSYYR